MMQFVQQELLSSNRCEFLIVIYLLAVVILSAFSTLLTGRLDVRKGFTTIKLTLTLSSAFRLVLSVSIDH